MTAPSASSLPSAEQALLQAVMKTAVDGIVIIDEEGRIRLGNPALEHLFGYPVAELLGQDVSVLMPEPYRSEHQTYVARYLRTGRPHVIGQGREVVGRRKDGTTFPIDLAVSEVAWQGQRLFAGVARDITERKKAEAEQAALGTVLEESLNEVYFFDARSLRIVQMNRGARENLGYGVDEVGRLTWLDIEPHWTRQDCLQRLQPLLNGTQRKLVLDTVHRRRDGSRYEAEVHLQSSHLQGRPVVVAFVLDISDRKAAERELNRVNHELEQCVSRRTRELRQTREQLVKEERMATLGRVSGGIAHEIRNPLNAIKTSVYYLLHAPQLKPQKLREHLERIDRQVTLANQVVTTLVNFMRLPHPERVGLTLDQDFLEDVASSAQLPAPVQVRIVLSRPLPPVQADPAQIGIALRNLLRNARDAMPAGGIIEVTGRTTDDGVEVSVTDSGTGIPPADLRQIFEPLFSRKEHGVGLGLAIARAIVEQNHGQIRAESRVGKGSTFTIRLPAGNRGAAQTRAT
jgi:two-component system sensor kinase FixL